MDVVDFYSFVGVSFLLSACCIRGQTIQLEYEEGTNVRLTFNYTYHFGLVQLKRDNAEIFRNDGRPPRVEEETSISLSASNTITFTLRQVDISDSGIYKCFVIGVEKSPVYNLEVISSEKFIGISKNFDNWEPYQVNETIVAIEDTTLRLACRVNGGLRSNCSIRWRIQNEFSPFTTNVTACDKHHEEIVLEIKTVPVHLDGSKISCESGELSTSIVVKTTRKPFIQYQENVFTEGTKYEVSCVLNDTSDEAKFYWSLGEYNITGNATQQGSEIAEGLFEWKSMLTFFPKRQHFKKLLQCQISDDEARSYSLKLTIKFTATITEISASPSRFVYEHSSLNITCIATGYPQPNLFWLKSCGCVNDEWFIVRHESIHHNIGETTFSSTIVLTDVDKSDGGYYKCRAFNGVGPIVEKDTAIYIEGQGILDGDSFVFVENQPVNISCQVKRNEPHTFIIWTLDREKDVTLNATQYEVQNQRGEKLLMSTLTFYPKRTYNGSDLTCQWGNQQLSSDTITVNISYAAQQTSASWTFPFTSAIQLAIIVTSFGILFIVICVVLFVWSRRRRNAHQVMKTKCPDTIGIHTLGAINAGVRTHSSGSSNGLYEDMAFSTTKTGESECPEKQLLVERQFSTYDFSSKSDESETVVTTVIPNCQSSLGDRLSTLFGKDFSIETKQMGNRLSVHFDLDDDSGLVEHEYDSQLRTCNMEDITKENDEGLILTIHSKLKQRGSFFFCDATVSREECSMNVTVKVLSEFSHRDEKSLFKKELNIVKNLDRHKNIAEVLGVCCSSQPNCIIFEKIPVENLKEVLLYNEAREESFEKVEILRQYAEQVCSGMVFLSKNEYCHPNLHCENIAVDKKGTCKLYDFVPVQIFSAQDEDSQQARRQSGLTAPEIIEGNRHNCHAEIWKFGALLLEIYCYGLNHIEDANRTNMYGQFTGLDSLQKPDSLPEDMYNLMLKCRCHPPSHRPSFPELLTAIKSMKNQSAISTTI